MATSKRMTAVELVALVAGSAEQLRKAGVLRLEFDATGRCVIDMAPAEPEGPPRPRVLADEDDAPADPFEDPATFGGRVPGFSRLRHGTDAD